jgi:AAA15 family ATPase/GTPase
MLTVFKTIRIQNFRSFDDFTINSLTRVNLIAGKNSVGKTTLLEAIFLLVGAGNISLPIKISGFRGLADDFKGDIESLIQMLWTPLFHNLNTEEKITITGDVSNNKGQYGVEFVIKSADSQPVSLEDTANQTNIYNKKLILRYKDLSKQTKEFEMAWVNGQLAIKPAPTELPFPGFFYSTRSYNPGEDAELFGNLVKTKRSFNLVNILKIIDERLADLTTIQSGGAPMLYGDIGLDQLLPISLLGDGMRRLISILLRIANATNGVVLIDEIENGFHYSIQKAVWKAIGEATRTFNTQVFVTTHSYEAIKNANAAFSGNRDFSYHRLDRINEKIEAISYRGEELNSAVESDLEVR